MDNKTKEYVAIGAASAVNCQPCFDYHLAEARRLGLDEHGIAEAAGVGAQVKQGAADHSSICAERLDTPLEHDADSQSERSGCCG